MCVGVSVFVEVCCYVFWCVSVCLFVGWFGGCVQDVQAFSTYSSVTNA